MSLNVSVVSASSEVWSGSAQQVTAITTEGEIGILSGHEPVLAVLSKGDVKVTTDAGEKVVVAAADGFLSVDRDNVYVVAGKARLSA
ncbi:F0F1 ATP synthase subunit epsilon [Canibacter sp. lx-45]|uniref:F0F1 ATP synthase subunit epsilon n=1 Tax=Canibacter zhuwentaonis TaxID=2837491 RepID=UPI001BDDA850|nr:F0F1 ATP synthase subunit epsilon [Canibacter zhuwentaonis]MBT1034800.1 F0F1 ATP synthase subunit epsilon [Canibacter zhuwentaonis]